MLFSGLLLCTELRSTLLPLSECFPFKGNELSRMASHPLQPFPPYMVSTQHLPEHAPLNPLLCPSEFLRGREVGIGVRYGVTLSALFVLGNAGSRCGSLLRPPEILSSEDRKHVTGLHNTAWPKVTGPTPAVGTSGQEAFSDTGGTFTSFCWGRPAHWMMAMGTEGARPASISLPGVVLHWGCRARQRHQGYVCYVC